MLVLEEKIKGGNKDAFVKKVIEISKFKNVHVVLGGWRRQFVIKKLIENKIPYSYFELPEVEIVNKMYNALDLYIISSRCEGGPQSLFECAYLKIPLLTTHSGQHNLIDNSCKYKLDQVLDVKIVEKSAHAVSLNRKNIDHLLDVNHIKVYDSYLKGLK